MAVHGRRGHRLPPALRRSAVLGAAAERRLSDAALPPASARRRLHRRTRCGGQSQLLGGWGVGGAGRRLRRLRRLRPRRCAAAVAAFCPTAFDGWTCWERTPAGTAASAACPDFLVGFDPRRTAFRECLADGSWFRHPLTNASWSNYTTCVDTDDLQFRELVNWLYVCGYTTSLVALLISLVVFLSFRSLRCTRIAVHVQLFLSFAANDATWIAWYRLVVGDVAVLTRNELWCRALHLLIQYLMVANYMWMFCEGLHLHLALVVVFVQDERALRCFRAVGWGLPAAAAATYALWRSQRAPHDTRRCWMEESVSAWALTAPVLLSLGASAVFLGNVLRVLLTKLHPRSPHPAPRGLRRAARAALILVPLFGLQHALLLFRPAAGERGERAYQVLSALLISLQGLCVACLFCFCNVDVHAAVRPLLRRAFGAGGGRGGREGRGGRPRCLCDSGRSAPSAPSAAAPHTQPLTCDARV